MHHSELTELLAGCVPKLIQNSVAKNRPIDTPLAKEFLAVARFADISGFTALTERVAERGRPMKFDKSGERFVGTLCAIRFTGCSR